MKRIFRFYCWMCDYSWVDILDKEDKYCSDCEYCKRPYEAEEICDL